MNDFSELSDAHVIGICRDHAHTDEYRVRAEQELVRRGYPTEGRKDDAAKIRYELLPPEFLDGTADILTFGARKYGDRNWEKGMAWSRVFGALMRHLWAWWRGEAGDPETGKSHLWHAACCLAFLMAYEARKSGQDDRPVSMS